jgi:mannosylglycerate hydrolase MGH1-like protein/glycosyl hydrolase family 65
VVTRATAIVLLFGLLPAFGQTSGGMSLLDADDFRHHVEYFNGMIAEDVVNQIPDAKAWAWMKENIPFFTCPDPEFEQIYYYRWWAFRKHIKKTPDGFVLTEFLRPVGHATDHNAISCALGHHISEGRWLHDRRVIDQYISFWLRSGDEGGLQRHYHKYSSWTAAAAYERWLVDANTDFLVSLLDPLILDYQSWEQERLLGGGLFWQYDVRDGMEESVSGSRTARNARPTINSYMYGNATAIAAIADLAGKPALASEFEARAQVLKQLVQKRLWDNRASFFKSRLEAGGLADVRELIGYTPWYFNLPEAGAGYERAWEQLMDPEGFSAPYGPTTAEQRHPGFRIANQGDDCQWNGPSWPFSTTVTLKALANTLHNYPQRAVTREDYFRAFLIYTRSQRLKLPDGRDIPWIDENLNPFTGQWQARSMKISKGTFNGRGDHYNHSGFADLVISGLVGLRPRADDVVEVNPLLPADTWDWFCLDNVQYHGHELTVMWDRTGSKFESGAGLRVFIDGAEVAQAPTLRRLTARLSLN